MDELDHMPILNWHFNFDICKQLQKSEHFFAIARFYVG